MRRKKDAKGELDDKLDGNGYSIQSTHAFSIRAMRAADNSTPR